MQDPTNIIKFKAIIKEGIQIYKPAIHHCYHIIKQGIQIHKLTIHHCNHIIKQAIQIYKLTILTLYTAKFIKQGI